ncbi:MAG: ISAzo13 family transposase [Acidobacteriia bacterium]|nr:ISAzo13 family transposase [Terriglobia bacterium]
MMERETAGDPISGLKWTRKTTVKIARQLSRLGIAVSRNPVGRLLRQLKFSLRTNRKTISAGSTSDRDCQFSYLCRQRDQFEKRGDPVLSVDAKKRDLTGNFKNPGVKWETAATAVNDHDFRSNAKGIGIPYGIYDTQANRGSVFLGISHETSAFAVSCLRRWWQTEGHKRYPNSRHILILADTGGSNGAQRGAWRFRGNCAMAWDSASPLLTTLPAPPNGIPSNTVYSARSAETGPPSLWTVTRRPRSSSALRPPPA